MDPPHDDGNDGKSDGDGDCHISSHISSPLSATNIITYTVWNYEMTLPGTKWTLRGHSRGSEKTGFYIPQLKLMFDAGITTYFDPQTILITHGHLDHSNALPLILASAAVAERPSPVVCCPRETLHQFEQFVHAAYQLNYGVTDGRLKRFVGVGHGDIVPLERAGHFAKVYRLDHSVPSIGYGIFEEREKLKDEFKSLSGKEISQLRKQQVNVVDFVPNPILVFVCDTSIHIFKTCPELLNFPLILVECTFFEPELLELAHQSKHIHWLDLQPIVVSHPKITFILMHFSMRYGNNVQAQLQHSSLPTPPNVIAWTN